MQRFAVIHEPEEDGIGEEWRFSRTDRYHPPAALTLRTSADTLGSGCVSGSLHTQQVKNRHGHLDSRYIGFSHLRIISLTNTLQASFIIPVASKESDLHLQFI